MSDSGSPSDDVASVRVEPPGPRSRELLERGEATLYPGLSAGLAPLVVDSTASFTVTDVDDNVYVDLGSASVPLGAGRAELVEPAIEAMRRHGNEDALALAHPATLDLADRLLGAAVS